MARVNYKLMTSTGVAQSSSHNKICKKYRIENSNMETNKYDDLKKRSN